MIWEAHKCSVTGMQNYKQQPIIELNKEIFFFPPNLVILKETSFFL